VNKQKHIIVLNGRRFNAKTGENLSHPAESVAVPEASHRTPVHTPAAPVSHSANSHSAATSKPVHTAARQPAGHIKAHSPKAAHTLMRQGVKRPSAGLKRRIRVQGHLDTQIKPVVAKAPIRTHQIRHHTIKSKQVQLISHFSPNLFTTVTHTTIETTRPLASSRPVSQSQPAPQPAMPPTLASKKPRTTAELLEYAIQYADSPPEPEEPIRRKQAHKLRRRGRTHAATHS
jgi:hypothetical protein